MHINLQYPDPPSEWILHYNELSPANSTIECSNCHEEERMSIHNKKYCPNCGANMGGEI